MWTILNTWMTFADKALRSFLWYTFHHFPTLRTNIIHCTDPTMHQSYPTYLTHWAGSFGSKKRLLAYSAPNHFIHQHLSVIIGGYFSIIPMDKNSMFFLFQTAVFQVTAYRMVVCKIVSILFRLQQIQQMYRNDMIPSGHEALSTNQND